MLIRTFALKVINNEKKKKKKLTHHEIIDRIAEKTESVSLRFAKDQNCGFVRTYGDHISHLLFI